MFNKEAGYLLLKYLSVGDMESRRALIGIYSANVKLAVIMSLFTQAYNYAVEPFFFNNKNREDNRQLYADSALLYVLVGAIAFVGIMAFLPVLKIIVQNEEMYVGLGVVPYLLFAYILLGVYYNLSVWFKLTDRTQFAAYIAVASSIVTAIVAVIAIPMFSYYGVAYAAVACYLVMVSLSYYYGRKYYPIPYNLAKIGMYLGMAVLLNYARVKVVGILEPALLGELMIGAIASCLFIGIIILKEQTYFKRILGK